MEKVMTEKQSDKEWEPKIVAIVCNWCTYAGADLAGISRIQYPPNVRIIRVPCTGRINPFYIMRALHEGADGTDMFETYYLESGRFGSSLETIC